MSVGQIALIPKRKIISPCPLEFGCEAIKGKVPSRLMHRPGAKAVSGDTVSQRWDLRVYEPTGFAKGQCQAE
jgi:hypothetical protein